MAARAGGPRRGGCAGPTRPGRSRWISRTSPGEKVQRTSTKQAKTREQTLQAIQKSHVDFQNSSKLIQVTKSHNGLPSHFDPSQNTFATPAYNASSPWAAHLLGRPRSRPDLRQRRRVAQAERARARAPAGRLGSRRARVARCPTCGARRTVERVLGPLCGFGRSDHFKMRRRHVRVSSVVLRFRLASRQLPARAAADLRRAVPLSRAAARSVRPARAARAVSALARGAGSSRYPPQAAVSAPARGPSRDLI